MRDARFTRILCLFLIVYFFFQSHKNKSRSVRSVRNHVFRAQSIVEGIGLEEIIDRKTEINVVQMKNEE